jgi:hypothetical protein
MRPSTTFIQNHHQRLIIFLLILTSALILSCGITDPNYLYEPTDIPSETPISTATPDPTKVAYVGGFAGSWDTNWGVMTCSVNGQMVDCNYTHDTGKIQATLGLDGMTMEGTWSESPSYQPPVDGGRVTFSLSEDGNSITGHWWYGQDGEGGPWTGTRK